MKGFVLHSCHPDTGRSQCLHPGVVADLADSDDEDCQFNNCREEDPVITFTGETPGLQLNALLLCFRNNKNILAAKNIINREEISVVLSDFWTQLYVIINRYTKSERWIINNNKSTLQGWGKVFYVDGAGILGSIHVTWTVMSHLNDSQIYMFFF